MLDVVFFGVGERGGRRRVFYVQPKTQNEEGPTFELGTYSCRVPSVLLCFFFCQQNALGYNDFKSSRNVKNSLKLLFLLSRESRFV